MYRLWMEQCDMKTVNVQVETTMYKGLFNNAQVETIIMLILSFYMF